MKDNLAAGPGYWRSLEHLADTPEVRDLIGREFPGYDPDHMLQPSRRRLLKIMGASMALAGVTLSGCRRWPEEKLAPYSTNPQGRLPGVPEQYATAYEVGGVAAPLLVSSYDGRPIKIEGNPAHPLSWTIRDRIGAADAFAQASLLEMYDPHRSRAVIDRTGAQPSESSWDAFAAFASKHVGAMKGNGTGLAVLSESFSGPSAFDMKKRLLSAFPNAKWYEYEPLNRDAEIEGSKLAFGRPVRSYLRLDKASRVLLLDADVLGSHPARVRYAADWAERRRSADAGEMNRVYVAETTFSLTGTVADVRLPVNPERLYAIALAIAAKLGVAGVSGDENLSEAEAKFIASAAGDLREAGKDAVVAAGGAMPAVGHALVHAINQKLGAINNTVTLLEETTAGHISHLKAISDLKSEIASGAVSTLVILGGNPAYNAPADLEFAKAIEKVPLSIHLSLYDDETSKLCKWHVPRAHYLESWGDARAWDGTAGIVQPLILPLYGGKSAIELLALLSGDSLREGHEIVRRTWEQLLPPDEFARAFRAVTEAGFLPDSGFKVAEARVHTTEFPPSSSPNNGFFLRFQGDSHVFDGRFANNGWLQETPDPLTKLVWDNAALIAKKDADALGVATGDIIRIEIGGRPALEIAAYVMPGQPLGVITLPLGYGRTASGPIGDRLGFNTYAIRITQGFDVAAGAQVHKAAGHYRLVATQDHHILDTIGAEGRATRVGQKAESGKIVHEVSFSEYKRDPASTLGGPRKVALQLFESPSKFNDSHAWGMAIDLNACIGCNACAVACQAENNIPIVGKEEATNHRAMNWIRIDRYFKGDADDPAVEVVHQPMMCQQCENAPCEQVCPVGATVHDSEGLNTMVYNRCIGTRYCSNNCPYKVRRFNYFDYHSKDPRSTWGTPWAGIPDQQQDETIDKIRRMVFNPDVSVRMRGVMEKCTYCVQRIHSATIAKRAAGSDVADGDIVTACQQACPTQAIVFGDLNDRDSRLVRLHRNPRAYGVLDEELNTRPRTKYLAKLRNPTEV